MSHDRCTLYIIISYIASDKYCSNSWYANLNIKYTYVYIEKHKLCLRRRQTRVARFNLLNHGDAFCASQEIGTLPVL